MDNIYLAKNKYLSAKELRDFLNEIPDDKLENCLISAYSVNYDALQYNEASNSSEVDVLTIGTFISEKSGVI